MRYLLTIPAVLLLAACGADGTIKSPAAMTPVERCDNAALALALVEANAPEGSATVLRARANYAAICGAPMPRPVE